MPTPTVLWIVGPPGVGKTTLVRELLDLLDPGHERYSVPKPKWTVAPNVCAAGHFTGDAFDGADTVPYNGAALALQFWVKELSTKPLTIFDGDRFSHRMAFEAVGDLAACTRRILHLHSSQGAVLDARRKKRGSNQNESWMRGRATKSARFAQLDPKQLSLDVFFEKYRPYTATTFGEGSNYELSAAEWVLDALGLEGLARSAKVEALGA